MTNRISQKRFLRLLLNCVLALLTFVYFTRLLMTKKLPVSKLDRILCKEQIYTDTDVECPKKGIITVVQGGRLANQIWEYASVWAAARETGLEPYMPSCIITNLKKMFNNLTIPSLSSIKHCDIPVNKIIKDRNIHRDNTTQLRDLLINQQNTTNTVVLPIYVTLVEIVLKRLDDIKLEFTLKPRLKRRSRMLLLEATEGYDRPVTYVGIHVRRTDYEVYLSRFNYYLAGSAFFLNAMEYFEDKYENVAFIVASDDPDWCRENLLFGRSNVHIVSDEYGPPELDLAVLASCNHSIIDYGTYGVWGALFAGGETVVYNITHKTTDTVTQLMPDWIYMD